MWKIKFVFFFSSRFFRHTHTFFLRFNSYDQRDIITTIYFASLRRRLLYVSFRENRMRAKGMREKAIRRNVCRGLMDDGRRGVIGKPRTTTYKYAHTNTYTHRPKHVFLIYLNRCASPRRVHVTRAHRQGYARMGRGGAAHTWSQHTKLRGKRDPTGQLTRACT